MQFRVQFRKLGACWPPAAPNCIQPPGDSQIPVWQSKSLLPRLVMMCGPNVHYHHLYQKYNSFLQTWSSQCIRTLVRKALACILSIKYQQYSNASLKYRLFHTKSSSLCTSNRVCAHLLNHVRFSVTLWTAARQLLCPRESPAKNSGVGCHFPSKGSSRISEASCVSCLAAGFFTMLPAGKHVFNYVTQRFLFSLWRW